MDEQASGQRPYLRVVVNHSQKCNMHCTWCHEEGMQQTTTESVLEPDQIVEHCRTFFELGIRKFKLVGGEPTMRNDLPQIIQGIRSIAAEIDLSMVTNGSLLKHRGQRYKDAGLNRVNVSIFSLDPDFFIANVGPLHLMRNAIAGIDEAIRLGIMGKINHVYHGKDDLDAVLALARPRGLRVNVLNEIPSISSAVHTPVQEVIDVVETLDVRSRAIEDDPESLPVTVFRTAPGDEIEIKHQEIGAQAKFRSCATCFAKDRCKEGIYAIRITPAGMLQPCIAREDNALSLNGRSATQIVEYLDAL